MYESLAIVGLLAFGLFIIFIVYTTKVVPKVIKGILWFLAIFGIIDGIVLLKTWQYSILFHLWCTGILFMFILLIISGIKFKLSKE
ncbi:MAG: hypothetical protein QW803_11855 [Candidatus Methanomethylicia archaeon]